MSDSTLSTEKQPTKEETKSNCICTEYLLYGIKHCTGAIAGADRKEENICKSRIKQRCTASWRKYVTLDYRCSQSIKYPTGRREKNRNDNFSGSFKQEASNRLTGSCFSPTHIPVGVAALLEDRKFRGHNPKVVVFERGQNTSFDTTLVACFHTWIALH
jgi:hypothetical protein